MLIDDEYSALKGLQQKVVKLFPQLQILQTFQVPEDAIKTIKLRPPDILFLDIEMPRMTGFELLAALKHVHFQVIFVTAYNEHALKAFKQSAVGYVLKPVDDDELEFAVERAIEAIKHEEQTESASKLITLLSETITGTNKLIVPTGKGMSFIPYDEVLHIEGYEGYTKFHLVDTSKIISSYNLGKFEKALPAIFFKCHKSHIINLEKVRAFENEGYVIMDDHSRVTISKTNKKAFLALFS